MVNSSRSSGVFTARFSIATSTLAWVPGIAELDLARFLLVQLHRGGLDLGGALLEVFGLTVSRSEPELMPDIGELGGLLAQLLHFLEVALLLLGRRLVGFGQRGARLAIGQREIVRDAGAEE